MGKKVDKQAVRRCNRNAGALQAVSVRAKQIPIKISKEMSLQARLVHKHPGLHGTGQTVQE